MSACGNDPKAANEANFEKVLNAHYAKIKQCVRIGSAPNSDGIIQEFRTDGRVQDKQLSFYNSLVDLGLLDAVSYQKDTKNFSGQVTGNGTPQVVEIINFTKPVEAMGVKMSNVQYTYRIIDAVPWANNPALTKQFEWLSERISSDSISKDDDLVLTNNGWAHYSVLK